MIPLISIVGKSGAGKTYVMEKLIAELKRRGYRVATIKHDVHGFDLDQPGRTPGGTPKRGATLLSSVRPKSLP